MFTHGADRRNLGLNRPKAAQRSRAPRCSSSLAAALLLSHSARPQYKRDVNGNSRRKKTDSVQRTDDSLSQASPVLAAFRVFQQELDTKHDKYERLVKLSRDITIESKRTIFLLHRVTSVPSVEEVLSEADAKLDGVRQKIGLVAEELRGEDLHQFHKAFTSG
ncbi:hypothetical protein NFI96_005085 [Prochilodus magdalenae]|nr:hypothetical protein NFI96_005085 [Prochilodus magdalenae]